MGLGDGWKDRQRQDKYQYQSTSEELQIMQSKDD